MKFAVLRDYYAELADAYYKATGELWPIPQNPDTGKPYGRVIVTRERLEELYVTNGMRMREVAEVLGCSQSEVSALLKRAGIPSRPPESYRPPKHPKPPRKKHPGPSPERKAQMKAEREARALANGYEFGGREFRDQHGYIQVYLPEHPRANRAKTVPKHTLVMERALGRYLTDDEVVHHINRIKDDNRLENLQLMDKHEHSVLHGRERGLRNRGRKRKAKKGLAAAGEKEGDNG